jgi:hypothetical protein
MKRERQVNRDRVEHRPPEPDESRHSYTESSTVTENQNPPLAAPPQETGTKTPHD